MNAFWIQSTNVGDTLTPVIVEHFTGVKLKHVPETHEGKLIGIGSTMLAIRPGDTIWGTGIMRDSDTFPLASQSRFLAVRGRLTERILGRDVGVYGDPALLLSLMHKPDTTKKYKVGVIPHYAERQEPGLAQLSKEVDYKIINVNLPWQEFVDEVVSCENIVSSSLHGIVIAESYGIPATWMKLTDKVAGDGFKFRDYLTGTGREIQEPGKFPPIPNLKEIQDGLLKALSNLT